jgi:hypothetical protein
MDCKGTKSCAAPKDLFCVDSDSPKLDRKRSKFFHSIMAKILFATKRARPDTATAIAYLLDSQPRKPILRHLRLNLRVQSL